MMRGEFGMQPGRGGGDRHRKMAERASSSTSTVRGRERWEFRSWDTNRKKGCFSLSNDALNGMATAMFGLLESYTRTNTLC
jgi:hypothetical protein